MTNTVTVPTDSDRTKSAASIARKLQLAERAVQEARRALVNAIELIDANENEPEFKTSTMKSLIGSLDITSTPLGMVAREWDQNTAARRSARF